MRRGYGGGRGMSFVSSSDSQSESRPYRGAEIAPPPTLGSSSRPRGGGMSTTMISGNVPPPSSYTNNAQSSSYAERERSFHNPTPGVSKHG